MGSDDSKLDGPICTMVAEEPLVEFARSMEIVLPSERFTFS